QEPQSPRRRHPGGVPAPSMNIAGAWRLGYHGQGVVVSVLDDGIDMEHPDLRENYDSRASFDVNGNDPDPTYRPTAKDENKHGTRCAGQIAAQANNSICIPGVAFRSRIGAIRMLDGEITDTVETLSVGHQPQHIHLGTSDDGATLEGPGRLTQKAFSLGVARGRQGLGSVFVWASGNGGREDNCNTDGYTNSIYTLSVGAVSESGTVPWYSESCSSTLAATYSSGDSGLQERAMVTTDLHGRCTENHTGTSASAPIAAGIVSLALSANPGLGWRDVQHLTVRSSNPSDYLRTTWRINGVGKKVSHEFGYGLMDALAMVRLARTWRSVPRLRSCDAGGQEGLSVSVEDGFERTFRLATDGCASLSPSREVAFVEHVQVRVALTATRRGGVQMWLHSPLGTVSQLLSRRPKDKASLGMPGVRMDEKRECEHPGTASSSIAL
uniref:P/Homo B domain-containing protein n=1 Tax=Macrostomum lignano TaxID=282301 RepID=A0A1I8HTQ9_9PLAT